MLQVNRICKGLRLESERSEKVGMKRYMLKVLSMLARLFVLASLWTAQSARATMAVIVLAVPPAYAYGDEIQLMSTDYPPYFAAELPNGGPLTEIVTAAFAQAGHRVAIEFVPWNRALEYGKAGRVDGLHGAWHSREREKWFIFSDPLPGNELIFYKRRGTQPEKFTSYEDLKPFTIGIVKAYRNPKAFEATDLYTDAAVSDQVNLRKLANGRIDLVLIDRAVAEYILATELTEYKDQLVALEPPLEHLPLYVMISRKVENRLEIANDFNRGLAKIVEQGRVVEILEKHGMVFLDRQGAQREGWDIGATVVPKRRRVLPTEGGRHLP